MGDETLGDCVCVRRVMERKWCRCRCRRSVEVGRVKVVDEIGRVIMAVMTCRVVMAT